MRKCSVDGCGRKHYAKGFCTMHYERLRINGTLIPKVIRGDSEKRFHSRYIPAAETDCWMWTGATTKHGYGRMFSNKKGVSAHRYSWELYNGPIPEGMLVCHHCDTPPCVNPDHLFLGTHKDNVQDSIKKGRFILVGTGEKHHLAKLTRKDVVKIRKLRKKGRSYPEIAKLYPVKQYAIGQVCRGDTWR